MSYLFDQLKAVDEKPQIEDKILLMGLQAAGKSAIKDVVFFDKKPDEVENYMATVHYERQFIDEEKKSLIIDSGGQESYWNEAVTHFRHLVFSNVKLLMWIIDTTRPDLFEESERRFSFTIRQFKKENPKGLVVVLCHKVDKIPPEELVPLLEHVKTSFDDPKYGIFFEASSIYYHESLKDLVFSYMKKAKMNIERFELITNIGQKIEESDEFQGFMIKNKGDPRIAQLMEYLNPKSSAELPTFGKVSKNIDLSSYDIIELVLIDKETLSPVTGTSSPNTVSIEKSMDYIIALQEFKNIINNKREFGSSAIILSSSNERVHAMIFEMQANYLLITSFSPITDERTKSFYKLITEFAGHVTPKTSEKIEIKEDLIEKVETPTIIPPEVTEPVSSKIPEKIIPPIIEELEIEPKKLESISDGESKFTFLRKLSEEMVKGENESQEILQEELGEELPEIKSGIKITPPIVENQIERKPIVTSTPTISESKTRLKPPIDEILEIISKPSEKKMPKEAITEIKEKVEKEVIDVEANQEILEEKIVPPISEEQEVTIKEEKIMIDENIERPSEISKIFEKTIDEESKAISDEELLQKFVRHPVVKKETKIVEEKEEIKEPEKPRIEEKQETLPKKKSSVFLSRLEEERKRYLIRQVELVKNGQVEEINISEENIEKFSEFLKEKSEEKKEASDE